MKCTGTYAIDNSFQFVSKKKTQHDFDYYDRLFLCLWCERKGEIDGHTNLINEHTNLIVLEAVRTDLLTSAVLSTKQNIHTLHKHENHLENTQ